MSSKYINGWATYNKFRHGIDSEIWKWKCELAECYFQHVAKWPDYLERSLFALDKQNTIIGSVIEKINLWSDRSQRLNCNKSANFSILYFCVLALDFPDHATGYWCPDWRFRTATARGKAEQADIAAMHARDDGKTAIQCAKEYAGDLVPFTPSISKIEG